MKAVVQRVLSASVRVEGEVVATMGKGLVALVGIHRWPHPGCHLGLLGLSVLSAGMILLQRRIT